VGAFPEGQTRDNAMRSVMSGWAQNDPAGAGGWLETLPSGKSRERAVEAFVDQVSYQEHALAAKWVLELVSASGDGKASRESYRIDNLARQWLQQDETAARAWIQQAPISEEKKRTLLKR